MAPHRLLPTLPTPWRWALAVFGCLLALTLAMRVTAQHHLERLAEATALQYANFLAEGVEGLEDYLAGGPLTEATRHDLTQWLGVSDVFRWKLFDRAGREVTNSGRLAAGGAATALTETAENNAHVRELLAAGRRHVELKLDDQRADRPAVYSEAYVPVLRQGRVIGVAEVYVDQTARRSEVWVSFSWVGGSVALTLALLGGVGFWQLRHRQQAERQAEARVRYLAQYDQLTGALNRVSFGELLAREAQQCGDGERGFAVLCIDLDRFKEVNDSLGHGAGDQVLRLAAERLRSVVRQCDEVARIGGDEFAVLQRMVGSPADVAVLGQRLVAALGQPYELDGRVVAAGGSVGGAIYGTDATRVEELLHKADVALYRAKAQGRNAFSFYEAALDVRLQAERELARDLREALAHDALNLHYQPLVATDGRTLQGFEALCRWHHPERGNVPPVAFIPVAEQSGQIAALGRWVLRTACREAARWPAHLTVSVNLSPAQFSGDVVAEVREALASSGLPAARLVLEITESVLMNGSERVIATLDALAAMGVKLALDDFGTGYSSLSYLWRFPLHKLKIDRAFTQRLTEDAKVALIVRSIIRLAHSLGLSVTAEGVETAEQMHSLQSDGCDELQGYLLGRPAPPPSVAELEAPLAVPA